jgi:DNA-binding NarL/FixJ family response regulator
MEKIRILIADDQRLFAESLQTVVETKASDIEVIGLAADGKEACTLVEKLRPDVVLMDVRMPAMDGVQATRRIKTEFPETKVMILTTFPDDEFVHEALGYGAIGYLLKDASADEVIAGIRTVSKGYLLIDPSIADHVKGRLSPLREQDMDRHRLKSAFGLSNRELDVLELLAQGLGNKEIQKRLFVAEQTVKNYISSIYSKLGVHHRLELIRRMHPE